jgi:excinuclease ABC subunit C
MLFSQIKLVKKLKSLPTSPGVYIFYGKDRKILYVGKAGSLKDRVGSYFRTDANLRMNANLRIEGRPIEFNIHQVANIEIRKTETVLEAYIMEQGLIKKMQPKYNVDGKDNKSFCYLVVTKEQFPRFIILRKTDLENQEGQIQSLSLRYINYTKIYGPYTSKRNIEIALKILRKIFPYHNKSQKTEKGCLDAQIGLCPGPYDGAISKQDYAKNIRGIKMILEGKKKSLVGRMKKEMEEYSQKHEFEKAAEIRNKIFALQHIRDVALIAGRDEAMPRLYGAMRIEGYDISNISGKYAVGAMVVFDSENGELEPNKSQYRKFKIKTIEGINDVGAMEEVLVRRLKNNWLRPSLIILDGGAGHLNMARKILRNNRLEIPLLAVAKGPDRKKLDIRSFGSLPKISRKIIEQIRDESHRFAIAYHRKLRSKDIF